MSASTAHEKQHQSYDPIFFEHLASIEDKHFWFRGRNRAIAALVRNITSAWLSPDAHQKTGASQTEAHKVLEVGCGTGNVLRALQQSCPGATVVGMDLYGEGLRFARQRTRCPLVQGDLERPAFGSPFDLIGAFDVIEHISDDLRVLRSIHALLKPGGALLLTVPAHPALWSYFDEVSRHCRRYQRDELRSKLEQCGFRIEYLSEFMACTYPLMWLVRRLAGFRRKKRRPDCSRSDLLLTMNELRIVPVVNGLLAFLLSLEAEAIRRRFVLPFGASLIVAARRAA